MRGVWGRVLPMLIVLSRAASRVWDRVRPQAVTAAALGLLSYGVGMIYVPAGVITAALCLLLLEIKVENDR